jgi:mannose-6-phosphate isomerase-like protein (cupin superfamily)
MVQGVAPVRRIVVGDGEPGKPEIFSDGPSPDMRGDLARPGFAMTRIWVTEDTPAPVKDVRETLHLPHRIEPPIDGSVCRFVTIPPDDSWMGAIDEDKVRGFFAAMGSPDACHYAADAPHPYMQRTETLDYVYVLDGSVTLVLDTEEVDLEEGNSVVQRGARHAWSNRTDQPCTLVISSHHGSYDREG